MAEQSREEKDDGGGCSSLYKGRVRPASPAPEQGLHGDGNVSPCEEAAKTVGGKQLGGEQERKERRRRPALRVLKEKNELRETDSSCMPMRSKQLCGAGRNPQERARRRRRQARGGTLLLKPIFKYLQNCH